jgi:hypothetical protein
MVSLVLDLCVCTLAAVPKAVIVASCVYRCVFPLLVPRSMPEVGVEQLSCVIDPSDNGNDRLPGRQLKDTDL